jgi:hypothetical protein
VRSRGSKAGERFHARLENIVGLLEVLPIELMRFDVEDAAQHLRGEAALVTRLSIAIVSTRAFSKSNTDLGCGPHPSDGWSKIVRSGTVGLAVGLFERDFDVQVLDGDFQGREQRRRDNHADKPKSCPQQGLPE